MITALQDAGAPARVVGSREASWSACGLPPLWLGDGPSETVDDPARHRPTTKSGAGVTALQDAGAPARVVGSREASWSACGLPPLWLGDGPSETVDDPARHRPTTKSGAGSPHSKTLARGRWMWVGCGRCLAVGRHPKRRSSAHSKGARPFGVSCVFWRRCLI